MQRPHTAPVCHSATHAHSLRQSNLSFFVRLSAPLSRICMTEEFPIAISGATRNYDRHIHLPIFTIDQPAQAPSTGRNDYNPLAGLFYFGIWAHKMGHTFQTGLLVGGSQSPNSIDNAEMWFLPRPVRVWCNRSTVWFTPAVHGMNLQPISPLNRAREHWSPRSAANSTR